MTDSDNSLLWAKKLVEDAIIPMVLEGRTINLIKLVRQLYQEPAPKILRPIRERALNHLAAVITAEWGNRCDRFEAGCMTCMAWAIFDMVEKITDGSSLDDPDDFERVDGKSRFTHQYQAGPPHPSFIQRAKDMAEWPEWSVTFSIIPAGKQAGDEIEKEVAVRASNSVDAVEEAVQGLDIGKEDLIHEVHVSPPRKTRPKDT